MTLLTLLNLSQPHCRRWAGVDKRGADGPLQVTTGDQLLSARTTASAKLITMWSRAGVEDQERVEVSGTSVV